MKRSGWTKGRQWTNKALTTGQSPPAQAIGHFPIFHLLIFLWRTIVNEWLDPVIFCLFKEIATLSPCQPLFDSYRACHICPSGCSSTAPALSSFIIYNVVLLVNSTLRQWRCCSQAFPLTITARLAHSPLTIEARFADSPSSNALTFRVFQHINMSHVLLYSTFINTSTYSNPCDLNPQFTETTPYIPLRTKTFGHASAETAPGLWRSQARVFHWRYHDLWL